MRIVMRHVILAAAALMSLHVSAANACINDRDTVRTEREFKTNYEFKSNYQEQAPLPHESPAPPRSEWLSQAATWTGFGLLFGAVGLVTATVRRNGQLG